jgi:uncharacterized protein (TIGR02246 family)
MANKLTPQERQEIQAFYEGWRACLLKQDFEGMAELYTEDVVVMPPNHPAIRGRKQLLDFMRTYPRVTSTEFQVDEIEGYGDIAYVTGSYAMTLQPEGAPSPVNDRGKYMEIRRKQPDGSWLLARDIFNSDLDHRGG